MHPVVVRFPWPVPAVPFTELRASASLRCHTPRKPLLQVDPSAVYAGLAAAALPQQAETSVTPGSSAGTFSHTSESPVGSQVSTS